MPSGCFWHEKTPHLTTGFFGLFLCVKKVFFFACFVGGISADYNDFFWAVKLAKNITVKLEVF
jgi:hypothetical protein